MKYINSHIEKVDNLFRDKYLSLLKITINGIDTYERLNIIRKCSEIPDVFSLRKIIYLYIFRYYVYAQIYEEQNVMMIRRNALGKT